MNYPPHLPELFAELKRGRHISPEDDHLYGVLSESTEAFDKYVDYFDALGLTLKKHKYDFYYFEPDEDNKDSARLAKIAVFSFILIDHIAHSRGLAVEPALFGETFILHHLPHLTLDSYRARLEQVGVTEPAHLREIVNYLKYIGWAKWVSDDEFCFLRPFHRMLDRCLELSQVSGGKVSEVSPLDRGTNQEDKSDA